MGVTRVGVASVGGANVGVATAAGATNVAVAGGLLLLQQNGAGKYTLDAWLKKKD